LAATKILERARRIARNVEQLLVSQDQILVSENRTKTARASAVPESRSTVVTGLALSPPVAQVLLMQT